MDMDDDEIFTLGTSNITANDTLNIPPISDGGAGSATLSDGYCGIDFKAFGTSYRSIHGYASLAVCLFGALANTLNLIVLTRKSMINPTNAILTGLALADVINMVEYIPFTIYMDFLKNPDGSRKMTYGWAVFVLTHSNFSQVCHTISIWLTVTLAVWRYIMVAMPLKCKTLCSMERAKWAIVSAYVTSPILCIPVYLTFSVSVIPPKSPASLVESSSHHVNSSSSMGLLDANSTLGLGAGIPPPAAAAATPPRYNVNLSKLARRYPFLMTANFWLYSVVIKIIPCVLLTVVSLRLINSLMEAKKRKDKLLAKRTTTTTENSSAVSPGHRAGHGGHGHDHESSGSDRTTRMLLAVLLLFLMTEFPQGLLGLLSGLLGDAFFTSCYIPLADLMDFFALLNSAINFILYCSMSKKFRETFTQVFHLNQLSKLRTTLQGGQSRGGGRCIGRRAKATLATHISSPSTTRTLLGSNDTEQTAV